MQPGPNTKFTVYEGVFDGNGDPTMFNIGSRFFSSYQPDKTPEEACKGYTGEVWYKIIGYADTIQEAQHIIRVYPRTQF